jgi:adenylosuccinate lyase
VDHFNDKPFQDAHSAINAIEKAHRHDLTELERGVIRHCQALLSSVHNVARSRHYADQSTQMLAERTAAIL